MPQLSPEAVELWRRFLALSKEGVRPFDVLKREGFKNIYTPKADEWRELYWALHKGFGRKPWMYHVCEVDPSGERPARDYQGRDWEGAVAIRAKLDAAIAT
jgi:hypothetical protein